MKETDVDTSNNSKRLVTEPERVADRPVEPQPPPEKPRRKIPKPVKIAAAMVAKRTAFGIALVAGVSLGVYRLFFYQPEPDGLFLSGRIEGYETDISAKIGGQIAQVAVREGDLVEPKQLLVKINDAELRAQLQGAEAQVLAARERLQRSRQQLPILQAQLEQANIITQQATEESQGRVLEAKNALAAAQASLIEAQTNLKLAQADRRRTRELFAQGVVTAQQRDRDDAQADAAAARVNAARQQVQSAQGRLTQAQATLRNTPIRAAAALQIQKQIAQARTDIAIAQQDVENAKAQQAQIQANLNYLAIDSPMSGNVITRSVEPGEVVAAGAPLLTLVNLDNLYLRGFIPAGEIGKVKIGQPAQVYLDTFPDRPLSATVTRVDPKASFTPENIYFKKDRVTQVFGVELTLKNPQGLAKPGMPADGRIQEAGVGEDS